MEIKQIKFLLKTTIILLAIASIFFPHYIMDSHLKHKVIYSLETLDAVTFFSIPSIALLYMGKNKMAFTGFILTAITALTVYLPIEIKTLENVYVFISVLLGIYALKIIEKNPEIILK